MRKKKTIVALLILTLVMLPGLVWGASANSDTQEELSSWVFLPLIGTNAAKDLSVGGFLIHSVSKNAGAQSGNYQLGFACTENAYKLALDINQYYHSKDNVLLLNAGSRDWPEEFFGVDLQNFPEEAELYTTVESKLMLGYLWKQKNDFYLGPTFYTRRLKINDKQTNGSLDSANLCGENETNVTGVGIRLQRDTRDSSVYASKGDYLEAQAYVYNDFMGSNCNFSQLNIDYRCFHEIAPRHILGLQGSMVLSDGEVPFQMQPTFGSEKLMRGFEERYRDDNSLVFQGEYRFPIRRSFSGTLFAGVGEVFFGDNHFSFDRLKYSGGVGLRYLLSPDSRLNVRLDIAVGDSDTRVFIGYGEVF